MIDVNTVAAARERMVAGYGIPPEWSTDPRVYEFEVERLFDDGWTAIGSVAHLDAAGTHITGQIARTPVLVTRDDDGAIRAFVNVCRHRGYPVATKDGGTAALVCRYHAWSYNLDGTLRNARRCPVEEGDPGFGLIPMAVHVAAGVIFVNPNIHGEPFDRRYPEFEAVAERQGFDLAGWDHLSTHVFEIQANWKAFNENVGECYHCPSIHASTFTTAFDTEGAEWMTSTDHIWYHTFPFKDDDGTTKFDYGVYLFPSAMLFNNGVLGGSGYLTPTGPETCRFTFDLAAPPGVEREKVEAMRDVYVNTLDEDVDVLARQHVGIASGKVDGFFAFEENEPIVRFFHRCLLEMYERALGHVPVA